MRRSRRTTRDRGIPKPRKQPRMSDAPEETAESVEKVETLETDELKLISVQMSELARRLRKFEGHLVSFKAGTPRPPPPPKAKAAYRVGLEAARLEKAAAGVRHAICILGG